MAARGRAPQGRFNAAQKLNAAVTAAFAVLFAASGFLLWYGERDTRFRFSSTLVLHDGLMFVSLVLVAGHLYLALVHPSTRHSPAESSSARSAAIGRIATTRSGSRPHRRL